MFGPSFFGYRSAERKLLNTYSLPRRSFLEFRARLRPKTQDLQSKEAAMAATLNRPPDGAMRAWYRNKKFGTARSAYESNPGRWAASEVLLSAGVTPAEPEVPTPA
jgi:hypothetical protein